MNHEELPEQLPEEKKRRHPGFWRGFLSGLIAAVVIVAAVSSVNGIIRSKGTFGSAVFGNVLDKATENKIRELSEVIQGNYYEEVDTEDLREGLYAGLFENLDEYSQYYTAEEYKELYEQSVSGTYCGIGASLQQDTKTGAVTVVHVYEGSPAEKAGLKKGDIILEADGNDAAKMDLTEFVSHIKGEEGTKVHLTVYPAGESEKREYQITRESLVLPTVSHEMLQDKTGYIQVTEFTDATPEQFHTALKDLKKKNMQALIVDLRSNPGGMLTSVCEMLDEILPEGLLVYTEDRLGKREEYRSTDDAQLNLPLAVLVDSRSASASEIFAGAIQDRKAGTIIGTTTYGKGVVQTIRTLKDGSAFKMTTNRYFTPGGTCIQGVGIKPDVEIEYKFLGGKKDSYSHELDNQIQKALKVLKKAK